MPERVAVIAAMEREVRPFTRTRLQGWQRVRVGGMRAWRSENLLVICGGIGLAPALKAAEAAVADFQPRLLVSAGFAGSLHPARKVPQIFLPAKVIDARSGREYRTVDSAAESTLLTVDSIADPAAKKELARMFGAEAVDMEAAAVAEVACSHGLEFRAVKAISEDMEFPLPWFAPFITHDGALRTAPLMAHLAARPGLWGSVWALRHNAARAADALALALRSLQSGGAAAYDLTQPSRGAG